MKETVMIMYDADRDVIWEPPGKSIIRKQLRINCRNNKGVQAV